LQNLYYLDKVTLLKSFIKTLLKDSMNRWRALLTYWAISYVYGMLMVDDDALDSCEDAKVRNCSTKGLGEGKAVDRTTCTKRSLRRPITAP
jgi:hypothetical protein